MATTITCKNENKNDIVNFLKEKLEEYLDLIDCNEYSIEETEMGLEVEYPIGEIYGYSSDYVQCIGAVFERLKEMYPDIGIVGIAYEYATITANTFGPYFFCKPEDKKLTTVYEWQICTECGKVVCEDVVYNSSQWDFEEGNEFCLCSPTCMLAHALSEYCSDLEGNASIDVDTREELWENEDAIKDILLDRILDEIDNYAEDFKKNEATIRKMLQDKDLSEKQQFVVDSVLRILEK